MKPSATITPLRETWRQLMGSARSHAPQLKASLIGLALAAVLQGLAFTSLLPLFQALLTERHFTVTLIWLALLLVLLLASISIRWWAQGFDYRGDMVHNTHELRTLLGEKLRTLPLEMLHNKRAGEVNATLLGNVDENLSFVLTIANLIATAFITPLVVALGCLWFDWRMGVALLLIFPLLIPLYRWRRPALGRGMKMLAEANQRNSADVFEYTQGLAVLRAAGCAGEKFSRLRHNFDQLQHLQTIGQKKGAKPNLILASVMELGLLLVIGFGITLVVAGQMELALLAALLVILVRFGEPLANLVLFSAIIELIESALRHINQLLDTPPLPQHQPVQQPRGFAVDFEQVSFSWQGSLKPAVAQFSTHLPERSFTALVGPSGSGKTSITRLLMRHADPQQGSIRIGGVDLRQMAPEQLTQLISVVFQDVFLFDDTLLNNIRMARPDASDEEVEQAARSACCHEFISRLPQGYQTRIGDLGSRLSGGERQRISIARALLKNAPIVILDEPTAALDTESELAVQAAINALVQARTVIVIAHRLSTIVAADQILVMVDGRLAEQGTHAELLAQQGRYARMWQAHNSQYEILEPRGQNR